MVEKTIEIKRGQVLSDILPNKEIPTNTILNKTLTGCGATYGEIVHAKRHSIIIEPVSYTHLTLPTKLEV